AAGAEVGAGAAGAPAAAGAVVGLAAAAAVGAPPAAGAVVGAAAGAAGGAVGVAASGGLQAVRPTTTSRLNSGFQDIAVPPREKAERPKRSEPGVFAKGPKTTRNDQRRNVDQHQHDRQGGDQLEPTRLAVAEQRDSQELGTRTDEQDCGAYRSRKSHKEQQE